MPETVENASNSEETSSGVHGRDTVELLDQANDLLGANQLAAATVTAGGALETHLRHLVAAYGLTINDPASIGAYNSEIARAHNDGIVSNVTAADIAQVTKWAQMRNDAAHDPGNYNRTKEHVDLMICGIRDFISRTSSIGDTPGQLNR
jgi:hypothetical protein